MISEAATEGIILAMVQAIEKEMVQVRDRPDAATAPKKIGRFALTQFEWSAPSWAGKYERLFAEGGG